MLKLFAAFALLLIGFSFGCKSKGHASLSGDDSIAFEDFIDSFPVLSSPFLFPDSLLAKRKEDTVRISQKVLSQFVPDSISSKFFSKKAKVQWYPVGKMQEAKKNSYLLVKGIAGAEKSLLLFIYDKRDSFQTALLALKPDKYVSTDQAFTLEKGGVFTDEIWRHIPGKSIEHGKKVYDYNADSNRIRIIMIDPLDKTVKEISNPIDSFSSKQKFTADYGPDKLNFVSIRDGRRDDRYRFFIHFQNKDGSCSGELRGEAIRTSASTAVYHEPGDPCGIEFSFTSKAVTLKEISGCGNHRGLNCSFDGSYRRKKAAAAAK